MKAVLSSKGQLVIPRDIREKMGLHLGAELMLELMDENNLKVSLARRDISEFFGMGRRKGNNEIMSIEDMDEAIAEAVSANDRG